MKKIIKVISNLNPFRRKLHLDHYDYVRYRKHFKNESMSFEDLKNSRLRECTDANGNTVWVNL